MVPRRTWLLLLVTFLSVTSSIDGAKRRSRLDLPIAKVAEAPLEDNLATASGADVQIVKLNATTTTTTPAAVVASLEGDVSDIDNKNELLDDEYVEECDPDNTAFELVTGYVNNCILILNDVSIKTSIIFPVMYSLRQINYWTQFLVH